MNDACLCKLQLQYRTCISYTISYMRYRIRYRIYCIRYRMLNVRYRMSDVRYRIRHLQKLQYHRFLVQVLATFVYDVVYDIVRNIVGFAEIVYDMQILCRYYTISYVYIVCYVGIIRYRTSISTKTYANTIRRRT